MRSPGPTAAAAGRLLDRLLLLQQVIPPAEVWQALRDAGCVDRRRCTLTFEVTCWLVLAMGLLTDLPLRQVFQFAHRLWPGTPDPHRSSLCVARRRLGIAPLRRLFARLVGPRATPATPGGFSHGLRLLAVDSTVLRVPDSAANLRAFGRATGGPRGPAAFPQVRKLSLLEVGTHVELDFRVKGFRAASSTEHDLAPSLLRRVGEGALLLWDRGFHSYALWRQVLRQGGHVLGRVGARPLLPAETPLADGSALTTIYPRTWERQQGRDGLVLRLLRYTHDDPRRVGCGQEHRLLTTLLDAGRYPAAELIRLYHERWEIELAYDEQKTHHDPVRPGKAAQLRSQTPAGVVQEVYALSLGHYVTRALMAEAADRAGVDPDRLSFVGCLRVLRARLPEYAAVPAAGRAAWYEGLLAELGRERLEPRRNRVNPRVVKVKMTKYKKKRVGDRGPPPLQQTFEESVVILR
jgi:hypothetical protein